ncbi:hypothetical protein Ancab_025303, partial [Ancistrocladus abbreviatus]
MDIARRKDDPLGKSKIQSPAFSLRSARTPLGSRSSKEVVIGKSKDSALQIP